jgi:hypothetical protein
LSIQRLVVALGVGGALTLIRHGRERLRLLLRRELRRLLLGRELRRLRLGREL